MKITERTIVIVLACVLVIFGVIMFVLRPQRNQLHSANILLGARNNEIEKTKTKIDNLKSFKVQLEQSSGEFQRIEIAMPTEEQMPEIVAQIGALALKSGLSINSIQPITGTKENVEKPINITVRGRFNNLMDFIKASEKNVRPILMRSVSFVSGDTLGGGGEISATFGLNILKAPSLKKTTTTPTTQQQETAEEVK